MTFPSRQLLDGSHLAAVDGDQADARVSVRREGGMVTIALWDQGIRVRSVGHARQVRRRIVTAGAVLLLLLGAIRQQAVAGDFLSDKDCQKYVKTFPKLRSKCNCVFRSS